MNAILFNCSPHKKGNTFSMLNALKKSLEANGIDAEIMQVGGEKIAPCKACGACGKLRNKKCVFDNDILNSAAAKAYEADAIIIGSPTYYAAMTPEAKALIDRTGFVNFNNGGELLRGKVGAAVVAQRRGGATSVFSSINFFFLMSQMIVQGSTYWNIGFGLEQGDVDEDAEAMSNMKNLGENIAALLKKLHSK